MSGECSPLGYRLYYHFKNFDKNGHPSCEPRKTRTKNKELGLEGERRGGNGQVCYNLLTGYLPQCHRRRRQRTASLSLSFGRILRIGVILHMSDVIHIRTWCFLNFLSTKLAFQGSYVTVFVGMIIFYGLCFVDVDDSTLFWFRILLVRSVIRSVHNI